MSLVGNLSLQTAHVCENIPPSPLHSPQLKDPFCGKMDEAFIVFFCHFKLKVEFPDGTPASNTRVQASCTHGDQTIYNSSCRTDLEGFASFVFDTRPGTKDGSIQCSVRLSLVCLCSSNMPDKIWGHVTGVLLELKGGRGRGGGENVINPRLLE